MTFRKALLRGFIGIPCGVFISTTISILISVIAGGFGGGYYSPVEPGMAKELGGQLNAVVTQYVMSSVLGFAFGMGSAIYSMEEWSIIKQTVVHFLLSSVAMLPVAYVCHWVDHSVLSVVVYFAIFAAIYFLIWFIQQQYWKKRIEQMNQKLKKQD